jgi:hypothetical protein
MKNLFARVGRLIRAMDAKDAVRRGRFPHVSMLPQPVVASRHTARMPGSARRARSQGEL